MIRRPLRLAPGAAAGALAVVLALAAAGCSQPGDPSRPLVPAPEGIPDGFEVGQALPRRAPTAEAPEGAEVVDVEGRSVLDLAVGDCFQNAAQEQGQVSALEVVACDLPHDNEVFAVLELPFPDGYPGRTAAGRQASEACLEPFADFVGLAYERSEYLAYPIFPTQESFDEGDREVACVLRGAGNSPLVGTARDTAT